jgi:hypothetical protein
MSFRCTVRKFTQPFTGMNLTQFDLCESYTKRSRSTSKYADVLNHEQGLLIMNFASDRSGTVCIEKWPVLSLPQRYKMVYEQTSNLTEFIGLRVRKRGGLL